ncbi:MAG: hypothetical protein ACFFDS_03085 [Candidatus Thorarchaeota archaeon]
MSKENSLVNLLSKYWKRSFIKGLAIGIGAAIVIGTVVGVSIYFSNIGPNIPEPNNGVPFSTRLAEEIQSEISNVVHVEIIGNGTAAIHERLIYSTIERIGDNITYTWNVTAHTIDPIDEVVFELATNEVNQIAQGLFDSINNTDKVGTYGQDPYPAVGEMPNLKWVTELYLANNTVIFLYINMESLILFKTTTWYGDFNYDANMLGADVLIPESAFDDYIQVLQDLYTPYM